jgi:hypothetical protein
MTIEASLVAILSVLAPVTPWGKADPSQRPRITYLRVHGQSNMHLQGVGPSRVRMQLDFWDDDLKTARGLADQAKVLLPAGLIVGDIQDNPDDFEDDTKLARASFDVAIW